MNEEYLSALALLKSFSDEHGAVFLNYITPFVGDAIRSTGMDQLNSIEIQDKLLDMYGIKIPEGVLNTITKRLAKRGFGTRAHSKFIPETNKLNASYNFDHQRQYFQNQIDTLSEHFRDFVKQKYDRNLSINEAAIALTSYADKHGLPLLRTVYQHHNLTTSMALDELEYVTSRFVINAYENDSSDMDILLSLAKGSKLASVLYLQDPNGVDQRVENMTAVIDTPILLSALGYQGERKKDIACDVLNLAYINGINLTAYDHTINETEAVLSAAMHSVSKSHNAGIAVWGVREHFSNLDYTQSDIEMKIGRLERDLSSLRISVIDRPSPKIDWTVDESRLEAILSENIGYARREPMLHDLDALTATLRLRKGRRPLKFENCRAIFVTSNNALAQISKRFFENELGYHWPLAMSQDDFSTLLWLKQPLATPDLPKRQVLGDAYSALEPNFVKWDTFLNEIDKLRDDDTISNDDYLFFRHSSEVKDALMEETLGSKEPVTSEMVQSIKSRFEKSIRAPLEQQTEIQAIELTESKQRETALSSRLDRVEEQMEEALRKVSLAEKRHELQQKVVREIAVTRARRWKNSFTFLFALFLSLGLWFSTPFSQAVPGNAIPLPIIWLAYLGIIIVIVVSMANLTSGWHIKGFLRQVEIRIARKLEQRLASRLLMDINDDESET